MTDTKLRLSLSVRGAQLLSPQECGKNPNNYDTTVIPVEFTSKKGKTQRENVVVKTRRQRLVKQSINIAREAYDYMIDPQAPPTERLNKRVIVQKVTGKKPNGKPIKTTVESTVWAENYTEEQRLRWHLDRIASDLGAINYTFEIFED